MKMPDGNERATYLEALVVDEHIHNYSVVFGVAAVPTATHFADVERLSPFTVTSGNGTFGAATNVLGSADTPFRARMTTFDPREIHAVSVSVATQWILRWIWGTASQTEAQAEAALQYSNVIIQQAVVTGISFPQEVRMYRLPSTSQIWVKGENATNNATLTFLFQIHEYSGV
jgi:hypothetical protein